MVVGTRLLYIESYMVSCKIQLGLNLEATLRLGGYCTIVDTRIFPQDTIMVPTMW